MHVGCGSLIVQHGRKTASRWLGGMLLSTSRLTCACYAAICSMLTALYMLRPLNACKTVSVVVNSSLVRSCTGSHLQCLHTCTNARSQALDELLWVNGHACQLLLTTGWEKDQHVWQGHTVYHECHAARAAASAKMHARAYAGCSHCYHVGKNRHSAILQAVWHIW